MRDRLAGSRRWERGQGRSALDRGSIDDNKSMRRKNPTEGNTDRRRSRRLMAMWFSVVIPLALLSSCYPGVYDRADVFPEMHYNASYRPYEPPRLSPPSLAVPVTGREIALTDFAAAADLRNPVPASPQAAQAAAQLFNVNCSACHGKEGLGNGFVAQYFQRAQLPTPVDFASARARARSDGQIFFIISNGLGNMPSFAKMLTPENRWHLVLFVRGVQATQPQR